MKNLGETIGENLCDFGKDFLDKTWKLQYRKEKQSIH